MNFDLTDEQKGIKRAAREFAEKEFPEVAREFTSIATNAKPQGNEYSRNVRINDYVAYFRLKHK